jgi:hypothetical protein
MQRGGRAGGQAARLPGCGRRWADGGRRYVPGTYLGSSLPLLPTHYTLVYYAMYAILCKASLTPAILCAPVQTDPSCIMQHMGCHLEDCGVFATWHPAVGCSGQRSFWQASRAAFRSRRMGFLVKFQSVGQGLERGPA